MILSSAAGMRNESVRRSVGFVTTLARLLQSGPDEFSPLTGVELVAKKVTDILLSSSSCCLSQST